MTEQPPAAAPPPRRTLVLDYAFTHPTVEQLKAAGVTAVGRYFGQAATEPKNLSGAEAENLSKAGISIVSVFEFAANQVLGGAHQARADVDLFRAQRVDCGMPEDRPVYFAADFDIGDYAPRLPNDPGHALAKLGPAGDYWLEVKHALGVTRSGAYGGYWLIKRLFDAGLIGWGFQTVAWSGGQWDRRACLRQTGATDFGNIADVDVPERKDFGQWKVGQTQPQKPPPPRQPGPTLREAIVAARTVVSYLEAVG